MTADGPVTRAELETGLSGIHRRFDDLIARVDKINGGVQTALVESAAHRIRIDEQTLKIGKVHETNKAIHSRVEAIETAAKILDGRDGHAVRIRDVLLVIATVGGVIAILRFFHAVMG